MANIASISQTELAQRRQRLRRQRRWKVAQVFWQTLAVSGLAGGLLWVTTQPIWLITHSEQIKVEGNQLLSDQAVVSLLSLSYPQSLWQIQPQALAQKLESKGPIATARVMRQLFPPSLMIEVKERQPVAIAQSPTPLNRPGKAPPMGCLDANGMWMPIESYTAIEKSSMPTLKVTGSIEQYRPYWHQFYQILSGSPVKVFEVDWRDPENLILITELGTVHLGPFSLRLQQQLQVLAQMRQLPKYLDSSQISYIDLKNPASPMVQLPSTKLPKSDN